MALDPEKVKSALGRLCPFSEKIFGAGEHRFKLNASLSEQAILDFEALHRVHLPSEYRDFVSTLGNGGAGPFYGLFPLGMTDEGFGLVPWQEEDGFVGTLSAPFQFEDEWNDLSGQPEDKLSDIDQSNYDDLFEKFTEQYWNGSIMNGAIPICHTGCALRIWLVVTGDQAGNLWYDKRADLGGIMLLNQADGSPLTFDVWYQQWLDQCLREAGLAD